MKKIFFAIAIVSLITSCGNTETSEKEVKEEVVEMTPEMLFAELVDLDQRLVNNDLSINKKNAKEIFDAANHFVNEFPTHEKAGDALEMAAKGAEGIGKYDEAINILHKLITEFDETDKTPSFMYNKARILEERLGKKENAKAAYNALIERFPEDPLSISAKEYLEMDYINMSDAEIIEFLNSQNQVGE